MGKYICWIFSSQGEDNCEFILQVTLISGKRFELPNSNLINLEILVYRPLFYSASLLFITHFKHNDSYDNYVKSNGHYIHNYKQG